MSGTKFVVVKMKELVKTAVFAVLGVVILAGLIYFFLHLGDDGGECTYPISPFCLLQPLRHSIQNKL